MTREESKAFYPILQAYAEGKVIECRTKPNAVEGTDIPNDWTEMKEHQPFGWVKSKEDGSRSLITLIISEENIDINCIGGFNSDKIMKRFTFDDGAVFGILEEE